MPTDLPDFKNTRKSTDVVLEMESDTLDAQQLSCKAFFASQKSDGCFLVADRYDMRR